MDIFEIPRAKHYDSIASGVKRWESLWHSPTFYPLLLKLLIFNINLLNHISWKVSWSEPVHRLPGVVLLVSARLVYPICGLMQQRKADETILKYFLLNC